VGWSFSVALPADAAPCHEAADLLRSVARAAGHAADFLDDQAGMPGEDFGGAAARSYRAASVDLGADARGVADDVHALAAALDDYADRIEGVRQELARIRDAALDAGLTITSDERVLWTPVPETPVDAAYERLDARATRAHADAGGACGSWSRAVQRLTTGPLALSAPLDDLPPRTEQPTEHASPAPQPEPPTRLISATAPGLPDPSGEAGPEPAPHPSYPPAMVAASSAPLPPPLLLPLPAAHAPRPDGFEGVLT